MSVVFVLLFAGLAGYITWYSATHRQELINNSYNGRQQMLIAQNRRGKILSANGEILAQTTVGEDGKDKRWLNSHSILVPQIGTKFIMGHKI